VRQGIFWVLKSGEFSDSVFDPTVFLREGPSTMSHSRRTAACRLEVRAWKVKKKERTGQLHPPPKHRIIKGLAAIIIVAAIAWVLGSNVGKWVRAENRNEYSFRRQLHTNEIIEHMGTIKVGDTLPDFGFEDLDRRYWKLSQLVSDTSAVIFFDYHCDNCMEELEEIKKAVSAGVDAERFILISPTNPLYLQEIRDSLNVPCRILYDENRLYEDQLTIFSYPMSVIIDQNLMILEITAGVRYASEMAGLK
jgi:peroxiredoxin